MRIAGVMARFEDPETMEVSEEHIERGISLVEYFLNERLRLESYAEIDFNLLLAEEVLLKYRRRGEQRVHVEHVHVHNGGKAIVGNIAKV